MTFVKQGCEDSPVPNQPKTPMRGLRLDPDLWDAVQREAQERGVSASDVMREAIREHIDRREGDDE
jgi:predicted transcriptional regulator